jgi:hypothetical protein
LALKFLTNETIRNPNVVLLKISRHKNFQLQIWEVRLASLLRGYRFYNGPPLTYVAYLKKVTKNFQKKHKSLVHTGHPSPPIIIVNTMDAQDENFPFHTRVT